MPDSDCLEKYFTPSSINTFATDHHIFATLRSLPLPEHVSSGEAAAAGTAVTSPRAVRSVWPTSFTPYILASVVGVPGDLSLSSYIRDHAGLKGTKVMCREGNCGACVVSLELVNSATDKRKTVAVNSCIYPVYACHGLKVTTVEGIGSKETGYNEVQIRLANFYGSQCGYCSPGWVMSMYSLLQSKPGATMKEIEESFSGNLCRCTGYRPILDAFKSFASDRNKELTQKVIDIEDLIVTCQKGKTCKKKCDPEDCEWEESDAEFVEMALAAPSLRLTCGGHVQWYKVDSVNEIFEIFTMISGTYMLVAGFTSRGIFKYEKTPDAYIDINGVSFLKEHWYQSDGLYLGANVTLSDTVDILRRAAQDRPGQFSYLLELAKHVWKVGNVAVRNISPRAQNALAYLNAGFRFKVNKSNGYQVLERPSLVYGNINSSFVHARATEDYLNGKHLLDVVVLQKALTILGTELKPDRDQRNCSPLYRRGLAQALLYKAVLSLSPDNIAPKIRSGGDDLVRPLSSGKQEYSCDTSQPPLYQPLPKLESLIQCSGEAEYIPDIRSSVKDLYAALVLAKQGPAKLASIDSSKALLFAEKVVQFAGQPVGLVVACSQQLADKAAQLISINYTDQTTPVLDVEEAVKKHDTSRVVFRQGKTAVPKTGVTKVVKGDYRLPGQYHFTLETLTCLTVPVDDDSLDVFCSSQWPQAVQESVSLLLNIPDNNINVAVSRLGGSYGLKVSRGSLAACACSLAAWLLQRPVHMLLSVETQMEAVGKRYPCYFTYEAGVDGEGEIKYLHSQFYEDAGITFNDNVVPQAFKAFSNVYNTSTWGTKMYDVKTDKPSNIWSRAGGSLEAITMAEHVMEHIAHELGRDPLSVRMSNLNLSYPIPDLIAQLIKKSNFDARKSAIDDYNKKNLWKKKGISLVPMRFPVELVGNYHATLSVYQKDATVRISHGGTETGQGINTKVAQICAALFKIPIEYVFVTKTNNLVSANDAPAQNGFSDESVFYAVEQCCLELLRRLEPVRQPLGDPDWLTLIRAAFNQYVNLNVSYMYSAESDLKCYNVFGATALEVEVDILTGEYRVIRADILEDVGKSLNQFIDIGAVEGAFVMGLGYFTSEELKYDAKTGSLLTNRPLFYHIPGAKDIPTDLRVYLLKNGDNPDGVLRSKAVFQPPLCLASAVMFAIRQALTSARSDLGLPYKYLKIDPPFTAERLVTHLNIDVKQYLL
ncbi:uncharacterized protein LOC129001378 [Macrosteles quadrilineatus]|uniref:uncharacterized protein LOC129001378 n=1 Tax=Macrosteles quadrilineatus TaxID=74068 RepID=UPI0023E2D46C|nr:uncharacterized protein LOC129001378 [Macrosteles quadrilineatus]